MIVTQVDFRLLSTTNLLVAFINDFFADQNVMSGAGGDLTLHFCNEALTRLSSWNMNLNGIINIRKDD